MAGIVPHSESGVAPMLSLSGVGLLGFWEFGMGGLIGWRVGQIGSVYKQPDKRECGKNPITIIIFIFSPSL